MAKPKKNVSKSVKITETVKTTPIAETPVETVNPAEKAEETVIVKEIIAEPVKSIVEEVPAEKEVSAESKPKRKTTRKTKTENATAETLTEKKVSKTTKKLPEVNTFIQGAGAEKSLSVLVDKAKNLSGIKSPKSINLYIKPYEDDGVAKVYYVVDGESGYFSLF